MSSWNVSYVIGGKPLKVVTSVITAVAFLFNTISYDVAWAITGDSGLPHVGLEEPGSPGVIKELNPNAFSLPPYLGQIKDRWLSTPGLARAELPQKVVIHIQDAHCNYMAQHKITDILEYIHNKYGTSVINLEGGAKDYDLSIFTSIQDRIIRQKVADNFVREGLINGAEYYAINNPEKVTLWGIEDTALYLENLSVYRDSLKHKEEVDGHLKALDHILNNLKARIYSEELLGLDTKYSHYKANRIEFKEYVSYLIQKARQKLIEIQSFANIYLLSQTLEQESKVDFRRANIERDEIISRLQKTLSKNEINELVVKTFDFKTEKIPQEEFYSYLVRKARSIGLELKDFPALNTYIVYISTYGAIDKSKIMEEMTALEDTIKESLYTDNVQRELDTFSKNLVLTKNIFSISITKEDYKYYLAHEDAFDMRNFTSFIAKYAPRYNITATLDKNITNLDIYRQNLAKFYECSLKRDDVFLKNMRFTPNAVRSTQYEPRVAIMMTGGFHTDNLCELFKKNNISYVSIMPNFKTQDGYECPYFQLLAGELTSIQKRLYSVVTAAKASPVTSALAIADIMTSLGREVWPEEEVDLWSLAAYIWENTERGITINIEGDGFERLTFRARNQTEERVISPQALLEAATGGTPAGISLAQAQVQATLPRASSLGEPTLAGLGPEARPRASSAGKEEFTAARRIGRERERSVADIVMPPLIIGITAGIIWWAGGHEIVDFVQNMIKGFRTLNDSLGATAPIGMVGLASIYLATLTRPAVEQKIAPTEVNKASRASSAGALVVQDIIDGKRLPGSLRNFAREIAFGVEETVVFKEEISGITARIEEITEELEDIARKIEDTKTAEEKSELEDRKETLVAEARGVEDALYGFFEKKMRSQELSPVGAAMIFIEFLNMGSFKRMIEVYDLYTHERFRNNTIIREYYLVALNKVGRIQDVEQIIVAMSPEEWNSIKNGEIYGALGRSYKNRYIAADDLLKILDKPESEREEGELEKRITKYREVFGIPEDVTVERDDIRKNRKKYLGRSYKAYLDGFLLDFEYYPGINAAYALFWIADILEEEGNIEGAGKKRQEGKEMARLVFSATKRDSGEEAKDYWCLVTMLESVILQGNVDMDIVKDALTRVLNSINRPGDAWKIDSTLESLERARTIKGVDPNQIEYVIAQLEERRKKLGLAEAAPVEEEGAQAVFLRNSYRLSGLNSDFVAGAIQHGGDLRDQAITKFDIKTAQELLAVMGLTGVENFEEFDSRINELLARRLRTRDLQDLHGPYHTIFDNMQRGLNTLCDVYFSRDSRTNIMLSFILRMGDCRQHAAIKQLLFEVWKRDNINRYMRLAYDALHRGDMDGYKDNVAKIGGLARIQMRIMDVRIIGAVDMSEGLYNYRIENGEFVARDTDTEPIPMEEHTLTVLARYDDDNELVSIELRDSFYRDFWDRGGVFGEPARGKRRRLNPYNFGSHDVPATRRAHLVITRDRIDEITQEGFWAGEIPVVVKDAAGKVLRHEMRKIYLVPTDYAKYDRRTKDNTRATAVLLGGLTVELPGDIRRLLTGDRYEVFRARLAEYGEALDEFDTLRYRDTDGRLVDAQKAFRLVMLALTDVVAAKQEAQVDEEVDLGPFEAPTLEGREAIIGVVRRHPELAIQFHERFYEGLAEDGIYVSSTSMPDQYRRSVYIDSRLFNQAFNDEAGNGVDAEELLDMLTEEGRVLMTERFKEPGKKIKLTLSHIRPDTREAFYRLAKGLAADEPLPGAIDDFIKSGDTEKVIINTLHMPWEDLIADAQRYENPNAQVNELIVLQEKGIVLGVALLKNKTFFKPTDTPEEKLEKLLEYQQGGWSLDNAWDPLAKASFAKLKRDGEFAKDWACLKSIIIHLGIQDELKDIMAAGERKYEKTIGAVAPGPDFINFGLGLVFNRRDVMTYIDFLYRVTASNMQRSRVTGELIDYAKLPTSVVSRFGTAALSIDMDKAKEITGKDKKSEALSEIYDRLEALTYNAGASPELLEPLGFKVKILSSDYGRDVLGQVRDSPAFADWGPYIHLPEDIKTGPHASRESSAGTITPAVLALQTERVESIFDGNTDYLMRDIEEGRVGHQDLERIIAAARSVILEDGMTLSDRGQTNLSTLNIFLERIANDAKVPADSRELALAERLSVMIDKASARYISLYAVHVTKHDPRKTETEKVILTTMHATSGLFPRNKVNFALNNAVEVLGDEFQGGDFRDCDYAVVVPLRDLIIANPGRFLGGNDGDIFFAGDVVLPKTAQVFERSGQVTAHDQARECILKQGAVVSDLNNDGYWEGYHYDGPGGSTGVRRTRDQFDWPYLGNLGLFHGFASSSSMEGMENFFRSELLALPFYYEALRSMSEEGREDLSWKLQTMDRFDQVIGRYMNIPYKGEEIHFSGYTALLVRLLLSYVEEGRLISDMLSDKDFIRSIIILISETAQSRERNAVLESIKEYLAILQKTETPGEIIILRDAQVADLSALSGKELKIDEQRGMVVQFREASEYEQTMGLGELALEYPAGSGPGCFVKYDLSSQHIVVSFLNPYFARVARDEVAKTLGIKPSVIRMKNLLGTFGLEEVASSTEAQGSGIRASSAGAAVAPVAITARSINERFLTSFTPIVSTFRQNTLNVFFVPRSTIHGGDNALAEKARLARDVFSREYGKETSLQYYTPGEDFEDELDRAIQDALRDAEAAKADKVRGFTLWPKVFIYCTTKADLDRAQRYVRDKGYGDMVIVCNDVSAEPRGIVELTKVLELGTALMDDMRMRIDGKVQADDPTLMENRRKIIALLKGNDMLDPETAKKIEEATPEAYDEFFKKVWEGVYAILLTKINFEILRDWKEAEDLVRTAL